MIAVALERLKRNNIRVVIDTMINLPTQTEAEIIRDLEFYNHIRPDFEVHAMGENPLCLFIFGSLIKKENFDFNAFLLGLLAVIATHLSANLINDYADSKSGADWQDKRFFGFFGSSKLIQENTLREENYAYT